MVLENDLEGVLGPNYYGVVTLFYKPARMLALDPQ